MFRLHRQAVLRVMPDSCLSGGSHVSHVCGIAFRVLMRHPADGACPFSL